MASRKKDFNNYQIINDTVIIYIQNEKGETLQTYIDLEDLEKVKSTCLHFYAAYFKEIDDYYAVATKYLGVIDGKPKYKTILLHKIIINSNDDIRIDHINHDSLDNRKNNLRITNDKYNSRNRRGSNKNNTSGYRNVCIIQGYYRVQLQINGKNYRFPEKFTDVHEAGIFAEEMRKKYYGDYAGSN